MRMEARREKDQYDRGRKTRKSHIHQHQQLTVGDIQHLHHPEDEGKPYGCQAIKASNEDAKN